VSMPAFLQRLFSSLAHPLTKPVGGGLTDLELSLLGCLVPRESLLHGLHHLHAPYTACFLPYESLTSRVVVFPVFPSVYHRLLLQSTCTLLCVWLKPWIGAPFVYLRRCSAVDLPHGHTRLLNMRLFIVICPQC
jgi:hypothetical protein